MTDYIFQIALVALVVAAWLEVGRVARQISRIEEHLRNIYYMTYYIYAQSAAATAAEHEEDEEKVKEGCVLELVGRRGCVSIDEVVELCGVSKTFVTHRLYRQRKVVRVDREGRVCPRETE